MATPPTRPPRKATGPRIVHIEDNRENRMLVRAILEAEGYVIVDAEDGLSGIAATIREQPDLVLLDVNLPGIDGYEVASIIKSFPNFATTPVIAVTAYAMEGDRQRTLVAGCDGYIQKPIDVDAFPRQIGEFLEGKRERVEPREEGIYLRELNQRLVYRLVNQVEELKRLNEHFVRRATQLAELHRAVQDITSEVGVETLLGELLPHLARALGTASLAVELNDPPGTRVSVKTAQDERLSSGLTAGDTARVADWVDVDWTLPLAVRGRSLGTMTVRHFLPQGAKADEEHLLNIVANQVAIAVENSRLYDGVKRQMVELKQAQAQIIQSAKLAAIGELVANIAHEINNPLTSVLGFASFLVERLGPADPMREELSLIQEEATRARDIVRDLLQFSRQSDFLPAMADLNAIVEQVVAMLRRQGAVSSITVTEDYASDLPLVEVDVSRLKQVFVNILNNAIHVMPAGGSMRIRTTLVDNAVWIAFTDTGGGIHADHLAKIFDPFFTTKQDVSGTGLGLSVSLGIVQSHGGTIDVETEVGQGSTFTVKLPIGGVKSVIEHSPTDPSS
jgi:signal transduction histidine kinase